MALIVPRDVGGTDDISAPVTQPIPQPQAIQPPQQRKLIVPRDVGGDAPAPIETPTPEGVPRGQQLPAVSQFQQVQIPEPATGIAAAGRGIVRGLETTGAGILQRGSQALEALGIDLGTFRQELEQSERIQAAQFKPTAEAAPIPAIGGEIVGQALGLPLPASTLKGAAVTGAAIGGLEFGEKGTVGEFARNLLLGGAFGLTGQFAADKIVGLIKAGARKAGLVDIPDNLFKPDGTLKPEGEQFLQDEGIDIEALSDRVIAEVQAQPEGADLAQALRVAQAKELGITDLTRADVSQEFTDQSAEFALSRQRGTPEADALRQQKASQNQQIISAGEEIVRGTGGDADKLRAGQTIQDALRGSKTQRREAINQLYNIAEQEAGVALPIEQEGIAREFFEQDFRFLNDPDVSGQLQSARNQLESFSVIPPTGPESRVALKQAQVRELSARIEQLTPPANELQAAQQDVLRAQLQTRSQELKEASENLTRIKPLTIGNAEQLRKNIRALIDPKNTKQQAALSPILDSIDNAIDEIAISDELGEAAQQAFKKARQARSQFGDDFEAKDVVQNIVSFKPGTQTDLVPSSVAFDKIMNSQARLENTQAIKQALLAAGPEGKQAWQNFKATAASELMGKALTTGKTASGDLRFSGANFNKALKNIGDDTLKEIFDRPGELARIKQLGRVTRDITILQDGVFTPSGAQVENALSKLSNLAIFRLSPVTNAVVNEGAEQLRKGARRRELSKVINPQIDVKLADELGTMSNNAVNILRLLALSGQRKLEEENK